MKIIKWIILVVIAVPLALVAIIYARNKMVGPAGWAEDNTTKQLKSMMKDPDSMVIRSSFVLQRTNSDGNTEISICGIVDGRNAFGGYAGGTRFVSLSMDNKKSNTFDTIFVKIDESTASDRALAKRLDTITPFEHAYWNGNCVDETHPMLIRSSDS
ncbi:hypothetical protein [Undibacterium sp. Ji49W]|uniref:hypothetical protein n=1 Tax=Undibacterium sp. Ji49W TaxID=3413040 RepID=UPI003BEF9C85